MNNIFLYFWEKSNIKYWEFNINPHEKLENQIDYLKEDLVQVEFSNSPLLIDIWYYPSFEQNWKLRLFLTDKNSWDNYLENIEVWNINELQEKINHLLVKYNLK